MNLDDTTILLIVLAFIVLAFVIGIYQNKRRGEMLAAQAEKRGGQVSKSGLFGRWELRLPYKGETVLIYSLPGSRYSPPRTFATLKAKAPTLPTLEIARNSLSEKIKGAFGKERVATNDEEFDRQCVVRSEDQLLVQRMLSYEVKQRLIDRSLRAITVKVNPKEFQVVMLTIPSNDEAYDYFIDTVFMILQKTF